MSMGVPRGGWYFKRGNNLGEAKVGKVEGANGGNVKGTFFRGIPKGLRQEKLPRGNVRRWDWVIPKGEM